MDSKALKYLEDIRLSLELIANFTDEINSFEQFCLDFKTQSAVERQLIIIGEATNRLTRLQHPILLKNSSAIISFRNHLAHEYDAVDKAIVWTILKMHIPELEKEIRHYL